MRTVALAWSVLALPLGLMAQINVPSSVLNEIGDVLPERSNAQAAFLSAIYSPNLLVSEVCTAEVIFLWEGAGYRNSLGYFTYTENPDGSITVNSSDLLAANLSLPPQGSMTTGTVLPLRGVDGLPRIFQPGERIGFFLIANGFGSATSLVANWQFSPGVPTNSAAANGGIGLGCYTTVPKVNREAVIGDGSKSQHVAMLRMPGKPGFLDGNDYTVVGFEDLNRTRNSDDDFNDAVFLVRTSPEAAVAGSNVFHYNPDDVDNDGVAGVADHFPEDPERAYQNRYPSAGEMVVAFEDNYPAIGDADYNDAVIAFHYVVVSDAAGDIKDILGDFHLVARGAAYDHSFGVRLPGLPLDATGTLQLERWVAGSAEPTAIVTRSVADLVASDGRVADVFASTTSALPPPAGYAFSNTMFGAPTVGTASARFRIEFDVAIAAGAIGNPPYDPYLSVMRWDTVGWDIHLAGKPGFADRPSHLPTEAGNGAFVDANGYPWALLVPTSWRHPLEFRHVENAYAQFAGWRDSGGSFNQSWFRNATTAGAMVAPPLVGRIPQRSWAVSGPAR
ncbi:MAG: LruC domain-containing protein [bacterium]|nr:LruC domain-containing protein [bacterium]